MESIDLPRGSFRVPINGIDMYCEVGGQGPLLVWLPGAFVGADAFRPLTDVLYEHFTVLTADANGQGRSTLGPGPITYVSMTADLVRLLDHLNIDQAHYYGISDGGCCGLHMLLDFSDRVKSVSMSGTPYSHAAYNELAKRFVVELPASLAEGVTPEAKAVFEHYSKLSPNPEQFHEMAHRVAITWATQPNFTEAMLRTIDKPALVITTDSDEYISEQELQRVADWIPGARAVKIPGMPHGPAPTHTQPFVQAIHDFTASLSITSP